jgi:hypothetical protein
MHDDVVRDIRRRLDQPPVQADVSSRTTRSPSVLSVNDRDTPVVERPAVSPSLKLAGLAAPLLSLHTTLEIECALAGRSCSVHGICGQINSIRQRVNNLDPIVAAEIQHGLARDQFLSRRMRCGPIFLPVKTIYRWRRQGEGPKAMRVGRYLRFDLDEVWAWLEERTA